MEQLDILRHTVDVLERLEVPYVIVGSFASMAYGETRFTQDIDIVAALKDEDVAEFLAAFSAGILCERIRTSGGDPRFLSVQRDSFFLGEQDRFHAPKIGGLAYTADGAGRNIRLLPDRDARVAAPEDVIIGKLWYYSEGGGDRHLRDIAGILRVTGAAVDRAEVERLARLLGYAELWQQVVQTVDGVEPRA